MQDVKHLYAIGAGPIKDEIVPERTAAHASRLVARRQGKSPRRIGQALAASDQVADKGDGLLGIVARDEVADAFKMGFSGGRDDEDHASRSSVMVLYFAASRPEISLNGRT